jgi:hypothetical protein
MGPEARSSKARPAGLPQLQLSPSMRGLDESASAASLSTADAAEPRRLMRAPCIGAAPQLPGVDVRCAPREIHAVAPPGKMRELGKFKRRRRRGKCGSLPGVRAPQPPPERPLRTTNAHSFA